MKAPRTKHQDPGKIQISKLPASSPSWPIDVEGALVLKEEQKRHPFDLEERTARFGENIVRFSQNIPRNPTNNRLIDQIVGCGTSVGANYCEANEGVSKKDFCYSVGRCIKEAKETRFFLRMIAAAEPQNTTKARELYREAGELLLIFCAMRKNSLNNKNK